MARVRPALEADRAALCSLWRELIEHHRRLDCGYPPVRGIESVLEREIARALAGPDVRAFVADGGEDPTAGFLVAEILPDAGWIHELFVAAPRRGGGIGRALVWHADRWFESRDVRTTRVRVEQANEAALSFWRAAGYVDDVAPPYASAERNARFLRRPANLRPPCTP